MDFGLEIVIVFLYAIMRVDLRFHIPDGAKGPGSYRIDTKSVKHVGGESDVESFGVQRRSNSEEPKEKNEAV
jgi:hypothetical protein